MLRSFDTHAIVERFIASGIKKKQAEEIVFAIKEGRDYDFSNIATKDDLKILESSIRSEMAKLEADIAKLATSTKAEMAKLEANIAKLEDSTKANIAKLEASTKADIAKLEISTKADLAMVKFEMIKWIIYTGFASVIAIISAMFGMIRYLIH